LAVKIGSGATPRGGKKTYLPARSNYALVRSQNVYDRKFDTNGLAFISDEAAARLKGVELRTGDVLLNITGDGVTFGRSCLAAPAYFPCVVNQHVSIIRCGPHLDPGFLLGFLTLPQSKRYIESFNAGGSRRAITKGHIESFRIPLPPLPEQRRIAAVLGALDDKIELNRQMNRTLKEMAEALFKSWFIDFDGHDDLVDSELGAIPRDWEIKSIGDFAALQRGKTYKSKLLGQPGPVLLGLGSICPGGGFRSQKLKTYGGESPDKLLVHPGDVYASLKGATKDGDMVGSAARLPSWVPVGRLTQDTVRLDFKEDRFREVIYWALQTPKCRAYCGARRTGSAQVGLSRADFLGYPIALPKEVSLVDRFVEIASRLSQRVESNVVESHTLAELRDTLLPKLISGELRVPENPDEMVQPCP